MDLKTLIQDFLEKARIMQVATSRDNQPWACTVHFAYDEDMHLYWISTPERRHSKDLETNDKVAGTVVLPLVPGEPVRGIQFQGIAKRLEAEELKRGLTVIAARSGMKEERQQKIIDGTDGHTVYEITPTLFVLFDALNFPDDPRQEFKL